MKANWEKEKENLSQLINDGVSYIKIGEMYGVTCNTIKKVAKKYGIQLKPRRKVNECETFNRGKKFKVKYCQNCGEQIKDGYYDRKFCSCKCSQDFVRNEKVKRWKEHPEEFNGEYTYPFIKRYFLEKNNFKCEECGWGKQNPYTGNVTLELHHIDGDCTNNREENIQLLCPNCHSLTKTFGSLNKESKRYKLKEYKTNMSSKRIVNLINAIDDDDKTNEILKILDNKSNCN